MTSVDRARQDPVVAVGHQRSIRATLMRGGTSKGLFVDVADLPKPACKDSAVRDRLLLRLMGSPDRFSTQIDGLGGATPSTSKVVLVGPSQKQGCNVEYLFGAVSVGSDEIDWSGNCGNLTSAVGPFAISQGIVRPSVTTGTAVVRMWQANIGRLIISHVPVLDGAPVEAGDFRLAGVAFDGAEIGLEYIEDLSSPPAFPTGLVTEDLDVGAFGVVAASLIAVGAPTVFVRAEALGLRGAESAEAVAKADLRDAVEAIRVAGSVRMGVAPTIEEARTLNHMPRVVMVAPPAAYSASSGDRVGEDEIDLLARVFSLGKLHASMTGTGAVALAVGAAVPGTVVADARRSGAGEWTRFGHPAGVMAVGATVSRSGDQFRANSIRMSRSARRLMSGEAFYP